MRYLVVTYRRTVDPMHRTGKTQMEETLVPKRHLRDRDLQTGSVILDFKTQRVVQATLDGTSIPKDWWRIRDFYHQHHKLLIENLERANGIRAVDANSITDRDQVSALSTDGAAHREDPAPQS